MPSNMNSQLTEICNSLDSFSNSIFQSFKNQGHSTETTLLENWGWDCPALSPSDLCFLVQKISSKVRNSGIENIDDELKNKLMAIPLRIRLFEKNTLPYLSNGNASVASTQLISLIEWLTSVTEPMFDYERLLDNNVLPINLTRRLRSIKADIDEIVPEKNALKKQIDLIREATSAAENLPVDLQSLKEAKEKVNSLQTNSAVQFSKIESLLKESENLSAIIKIKKEEADKLVAQCEEAHRITTTIGLAAAFDERSQKLSVTTLWWVIGLLVSLVLGSYIGFLRFEVLSKTLESKNPEWGIIWIHLILSLVGLAAPIWFAWVATKQINLRFRLSEDYAFKASVAKAYEGYRREAARIDESFETRLFSSALSRLEEAPLRLVENDYHGSPWQEFFNSKAFQDAISTIPELKQDFMSLAKHGIDTIKHNKKEEN